MAESRKVLLARYEWLIDCGRKKLACLCQDKENPEMQLLQIRDIDKRIENLKRQRFALQNRLDHIDERIEKVRTELGKLLILYEKEISK